MSNASTGRLVVVESVRGFAAAYVVVSHLWVEPAWPLRFGQEAVIAFFVLSGFVVHHASRVARAPEPAAAYLLRRARRIYPVFLAALAVAWACRSAALGRPAPADWRGLVGNLCQLQDLPNKPGVWFTPYGGDLPLWSLAYEWWFYLLYPAVMALPSWRARRGAVAVVAAAGAACGRLAPCPFANYAGYFPIWWAGVELAREYARTGRATLRGQAAALALVAGVAAAWVPAAAAAPGPRAWGKAPLLPIRHAAAAAAMVAGVAVAGRRPALARPIGVFAALSPISYGLYAVHQPLLALAPAGGGGRAAAVAAAAVAAYVLERRLQPAVDRATAPLLRRLARAPAGTGGAAPRPHAPAPSTTTA